MSSLKRALAKATRAIYKVNDSASSAPEMRAGESDRDEFGSLKRTLNDITTAVNQIDLTSNENGSQTSKSNEYTSRNILGGTGNRRQSASTSAAMSAADRDSEARSRLPLSRSNPTTIEIPEDSQETSQEKFTFRQFFTSNGTTSNIPFICYI